MKYILLLNICIACFTSNSQTIVTDRPDQTESSACVEKGKLQIESGVSLEYTEEKGVEHQNILIPTTLFRVGLSPFFELRLLSQFEGNSNNGFYAQGISDLEIGTKIQLYQRQNARFEMAFLSHLRVPSGSKAFRNPKMASLNKLCLSNQMTENITLGYNLGYNYEGENKGDGTYSLSLSYSVSDKVGVYAEPYGTFYNFEVLEANFDAGFTYLIKDNLQFDFSFGTGLNQRMNYLSLGLSWKSK